MKKRKPWRPKIKPSDLCRQFTWLDNTLSYSFCNVCLTKVSRGIFHLGRHEKTSAHIKRNQTTKTTPLLEMYLQKAFICLHNLPFLLLDYLPVLHKRIFPDSEICRRVQMKRKKANQLVDVLTPHVHKELIQHLKMNAFSFIIDEVTHISTEKSLIIIVRYWKDRSMEDRVLDPIKVENATSEAICTSLKNLLD